MNGSAYGKYTISSIVYLVVGGIVLEESSIRLTPDSPRKLT
jgi:hypothetical protein